MEATALSVGKSVLNGALGYAKSAIAEEVALQLGVERDQAFVSDELEMMQAFLMAAHEEQVDNRVVKTWVKQVRDVAYDVEDSLQDFAVLLHKQSWWRFPRTLLDRRHVAKEMKKLRAKVEDVSQRNVRYQLIRRSGSKPPAAGGQTTISSEVALHIAEATRRALQEKERVNLVELITKDDENELKAIAICGAVNDVGVTSIIRAAYEDKLVKEKFKCRAWVRLVHPFNPNDFFVSLVRQFYEDHHKLSEKAMKGSAVGLEVLKEMATKNNLVDEFNRYVTEEKYLVVVTDVSTIEEWDWIKTYFPSKNGSRIIVSTQQFEVASLCTEQPYTLSEIVQQWSPEKDFYVFYKKVDGPTKEADKTPEAEISSADPSAGEEYTKKPTRAGTVAAFEDDQLIDRANAKAEVVRLIDLGGEVITIFGMGGLGKTTLARSLYQQELAEKFQRRAWLTISGSLDPDEFCSNLFRQLRDDHDAKSGNDKMPRVAEEKEETEAPLSKKNKETKQERLLEKLAKILQEQRCLIALDDLPSIVEWQVIMQLLPSTRNIASRIIVTTRQKNVAIRCCLGENKIYDLGLLTKTEAMDLFQKKVFKDINERNKFCNTPSLIEQANLILDKCGGLPLAISTIGSFLVTKPKTATEWIDLNKHISSELEMNPELGMLKSVLTSSYDALPYDLKSPFLYFSIFPQAHCIRWKRLVRRWIAEGYSRETRNITAEESGTRSIIELTNRNMVRLSKGSSHSSVGINKWMVRSSKGTCHRAGRVLQVHDLMREIGISNAAEENLVFTLENGCKFNTQGRIRHLAVSTGWTRDANAFESALDLSRIRSLTVFGGLESFVISNKMRLLRVLDLEDATGLRDHHICHIGEFVHLNYLSLRRCAGILRLPNSIGNLTCLHTLDVRDTCIINLPRTIVKLRKLQYLRVGFVPEHDEKEERQWSRPRFEIRDLFEIRPRFGIRPMRQNLLFYRYIFCFPAWLLVGLCYLLVGLCYCLFFLPGLFFWVLARDGLDGLPATFQRMDPRGVKFPRGVRKLMDLHTMGIVNIDGGDGILKDLRHLTQLRKLRVTGINKKNSHAFFKAIVNHRCLESLMLRAEGDPGLSSILDVASLRQLKNLRSLKLYGNLGMLPRWVKWLENLVKMELRSSRIAGVAETLEILGGLQSLAILRLGRNSFKGEEVCLNFLEDTFKTLVELEMDLPSNIKSVGFGEGAMPVLKKISFNLCCSSYIPSTVLFSGLKSLVSLKELVLSGSEYNDVEGLRAQLRLNLKHPVLKRE